MENRPSLETIVLERILGIPEFEEGVLRIAKNLFTKMSLEQRLTRKQMGDLFQVCPETIDNLTSGELDKLGWEKIYVGSLPRFQRIRTVEANNDIFKKVKRESR
jgi:hypothetical protein